MASAALLPPRVLTRLECVAPQLLECEGGKVVGVRGGKESGKSVSQPAPVTAAVALGVDHCMPSLPLGRLPPARCSPAEALRPAAEAGCPPPPALLRRKN